MKKATFSNFLHSFAPISSPRPAVLVWRIIFALAGVILTAVNIALLRHIAWGDDPFTVFVMGFHHIFDQPYGTVYPIVTAVMLMIPLLFDRSFIGISTILNLTCIGFTADFVYDLLIPVAPETIGMRIVWLLLALIAVCFGAALYYTANLGVSAYDSAALILAKRQKKVRFRFCRIGCDAVCVLVGWLCGATVGITTLLWALGMGPIIQFLEDYVTDPWMRRIEKGSTKNKA